MAQQVIYRQMSRVASGEGRVIKTNGKIVAQVKDGKRWRAAGTRRALALLQNLAHFMLLQPGDKVVAWTGSKLVAGAFISSLGEVFQVALSRTEHVYCTHVLPIDVACAIGVWEFRPDIQVAAFYGDRRPRGTWQLFADGEHTVQLVDIVDTLIYPVDYNRIGFYRLPLAR